MSTILSKKKEALREWINSQGIFTSEKPLAEQITAVLDKAQSIPDDDVLTFGHQLVKLCPPAVSDNYNTDEITTYCSDMAHTFSPVFKRQNELALNVLNHHKELNTDSSVTIPLVAYILYYINGDQNKDAFAHRVRMQLENNPEMFASTSEQSKPVFGANDFKDCMEVHLVALEKLIDKHIGHHSDEVECSRRLFLSYRLDNLREAVNGIEDSDPGEIKALASDNASLIRAGSPSIRWVLPSRRHYRFHSKQNGAIR